MLLLHEADDFATSNHLLSKLKDHDFLFDGILSLGKTRHYVDDSTTYFPEYINFIQSHFLKV